MIFKSEKRFYDEKQQKYTLPLCSFDTDAICVTTVDVRTGKVREDNFYSEYIRRHVPHVLKHQPERFQELVNKGKIYDYLLDIETKAKDAVDRQVEKWKANDRDYQLAVKNGDVVKQVRIVNSLEHMAKEAVFPAMIYV